jgi:hypothetical protein
VSTRGRPGRLTISRDTLSFAGGWYLMIYQAQFAEQFNLSVFLGGMVIAGVPGALQVLAALLGTRTGEPSPPSPEPASSVEPST